MMNAGVGFGTSGGRRISAEPLDAWRQAGQRLTHGGYTHYLRVGGEGPPVLLIHGYPTSSYDWHRVWNRLCSGHRVFAADFLGLGLSDKPIGHRYSILDHADFLEALLRKFGLEAIQVVAHDLGVSVVQEMLARRLANPALPKITSVVLLNSCLFGDGCRPPKLHALLTAANHSDGGTPISRPAFVASLKELFAPGGGPGAAELTVWWRLLSSREGLRVCARVGRFLEEQIELRERLMAPLIRNFVPTRFVSSSLDPHSVAAATRRFRELVPRGEVIELPYIGHWPHLEAPGLVAASVLEFFHRHGG